MRDFELPGRSPVFATLGMAATPNPHATRVAIEVLRAGGNAVDAAIAAAAVLAVVEPNQTGIGGDGFAILAKGGRDELVGWNGSGRAPAAIDLEAAARGWDPLSVHAVTVPGVIDTWCSLNEAHGTKPLAELLAPAIAFAADGWRVHPRCAFEWSTEVEKLSRHAATKALLLPGGKAPVAGDLMRNPGLADALRLVAAKGRAGFYEGEVAAEIVGTLRALGGSHAESDLAVHRGEWVTPIRTSYRGVESCQIPPNNQGITGLMMLNLLEGLPVQGLAPMDPLRLHYEIEAARLAYRDRNRFIADPRAAEVDVAALLSKDRAAGLRAAIHADRAMSDLPDPGLRKSDTIYLTVVDRDLNACSLINSVYHAFGSGIVAPRFGIVLQNRGFGFTLEDGHPNRLAPGKRPLHTIMPGMAVQDGKLWASFGVMGGDYQPMGHAHVLTAMVDQGLDPQEALDQPRVHHMGGVVQVENGVPEASRRGLEKRGHQLGRPPEPLGGGQIVRVDHGRGVLIGASDPRMDGCALGY